MELAGKIEMPLIPVLMKMEHHGVNLDVGALKIFAGELREQIVDSESEIHKLAGFEFNISANRNSAR